MSSPIRNIKNISPAQRLQFDSRGFLHLPKFFEPDFIKRVLFAYESASQRYIAPVRATSARSNYNIANVLDCDPVFTELAVHPRLLPYLLDLVGDDVQLVQACARLFPPGRTFTAPWHSDMPNTLGVDLGNSIHFHMKAHFFFEDLTRDQGCLAFLPGTHRRSRELPKTDPRDIDPEQDAVVMVPKAGDVVLFNTHCLHMCLDNTTSRDRRNLIYS